MTKGKIKNLCNSEIMRDSWQLTKEEAEREQWGKKYYFLDGSGKYYILRCELCSQSIPEEKLLGGHHVCSSCRMKFKLRREETVVKRIENWNKINNISNLPELSIHEMKDRNISALEKERKRAWIKIIKLDHEIALVRKIFKEKYGIQ